MSIENFPEGKIQSEEKLPEWVDRIKNVYEKVMNDKKAIRKLSGHARTDLKIYNELLANGKITKLQYWEDIRDWLHNYGIFDAWWGVENIEK